MRFLIGYTESYRLFSLIGPISSFNSLKKFCDKSRSNFEKKRRRRKENNTGLLAY